jgi:hypothetical protein
MLNINSPPFQELVSKPTVALSDVKKSIQSHLKNSAWNTKLQNAVYQELKRLTNELRPCNADNLSFIFA